MALLAAAAAPLSACGGRANDSEPQGPTGSGGTSNAGAGGTATAGSGGSGATAAGGATATGGTMGTGGATAAGGTMDTGGTTAAGGATGTGGAEPIQDAARIEDAEVCPTGRITLQIKPAAGQLWCRAWYFGTVFKIRSIGGDPIKWDDPCVGCRDGGMNAPCIGCQDGGVDAGAGAPIDPDGIAMTWEGIDYDLKPCDASDYPLCACKRCVPPGKYVATLQALAGAGPSSEAGCWYGQGGWVTHEETFDWPSTTTITWVVGEQADGD